MSSPCPPGRPTPTSLRPPPQAEAAAFPTSPATPTPSSGYTVRVDGKSLVIGGTSAVAPLWAGLIAVANAQNGQSAGFIQPAIYAAKGKVAFNDITSGTNYSGTPVGFKAGPGWDACTGLGSPIGTKLITVVNPGTTASAKRKGKNQRRPKKSRPPVRRSR